MYSVTLAIWGLWVVWAMRPWNRVSSSITRSLEGSAPFISASMASTSRSSSGTQSSTLGRVRARWRVPMSMTARSVTKSRQSFLCRMML